MATIYRLVLRSLSRCSPQIAYQTLPCHIRLISSCPPPTHHPGHPWILFHVPTMWVLLSMVVPHEQKHMHIKCPSPPDYLYISSCYIRGSKYPTRNRSFSFLASAIWAVEVSWLLDTKEDSMNTTYSYTSYLIVCKSLSNDDVGVSRDTIFQEIRPEAVFETGDSGK